MHTLSHISNIHTIATDKSALVTAEGFRTLIVKHVHPKAIDKRYRVRWLFDESLSDPPSRIEHFNLRKQLHEALNGY